MKIRVYSDIHLDHYQPKKLWYPPSLPDDEETTLILAGDLWTGTKWIFYNGESWIAKVASQFKQVIVVLGNHDYWPCNQSISIVSGASKCNEMLNTLNIHNVKVLDMDTFHDGDYLFIGATLWTDMGKENPLAMFKMQQYMAQDGKIAYETGPNGKWSRFTSDKWVRTHYKHRDYIKLVANQNKDKKLIVITHHLPLLTLGDPKYAADEGNVYYMSDLSDLILDNPNIKLWCYGHTHYQYDTMMVNTRLINNCVGYQGELYEHLGLISHKTILV